MTAKVGIRDIVINFSMLDDYDFVEIEDKKIHKRKGMFISDKYVDEVKSILDKKISLQKQERLNEIMQYAGKFEIEERFNNLSAENSDFSIKNKTDLEDTLQCFCAKENNCNIFLTSDKKFIDCGIKIQNYKEFLS